VPSENHRRTDALRREELARAAQRREAAAAQLQLDEFVTVLRAAGVKPHPLQATLLNGVRVRTGLLGWYLNRAETIAIDQVGRYFQLICPGSPLARITGVRVHPAEPTLVVGRGGRDGETGDLSEFLERALQRYNPVN
jgi:hypothetical protein